MKVEKFGRIFFDWTDTPSILMDAGGVIRLSNPAFQKTFTEEQIKEISFSHFLNESGKIAFRAFLNSLILKKSENTSDKFRHIFATQKKLTNQEWEWRFAKYEHFFLVQGKACGPDQRAAFFERHGGTGIAVLADGIVSDANDRFINLFGYSNTEGVVGKDCVDFTASESKSVLESERGGSSQQINLSMMRSDGSRFAALVRFQDTIFDDQVVRVMMVDAQRSTTQTLMESGLMFGAMFDSAATGILLSDKEGKVLEVNRAFCEMLGYSKDALPGKPTLEFIYRKDRRMMRDELFKLEDDSINKFRIETRLKKKNKRLLFTDITIDRIKVAGGEPYYLATIIDIDQRVKAEKNLTLRAHELARSNDDLEKFAYVASHDLQEPLRTVSVFLQLLHKKYYNKLDEEGNHYIDLVIDGAARMRELIQDLLEYSRIQQEVRAQESIDFNNLLDEVNINLREVTESNEANVLAELLPTIRANKSQMMQLFQNLIENAIKFKGECVPEVIVSVEDKKDRYQFSISDNGIGIEPQFGKRIFTLFQRLHNRQDYVGNGIGLAICKKIVENHGGKIWVDPEAQKGSVFHFTLKK